MMRSLLLASTSPYRAKILRDAGIRFRTAAPGVDESTFVQPDPVERALALAAAKAEALPTDDIVLAADQVVFDPESGAIFGKPRDPDDHFSRLRSMQGRWHVLVTGFAIRDGAALHTGHALTRMKMRTVSDVELRAYVASGEGSGCAGGYAAEGRGGFLIERIDGDWYNVIGLPLFDVMSHLRQLGWRFEDG